MEQYSPPLTRARARKVGVKARIFDVITTDSSAIPSSTSSNTDPSINCEIKKVKLSKDELEMNGAPAGDIFDIKVLFDNELMRLAQPESQIDSALTILNNTISTWAERYGAIEVLRRITLFNPVLMTNYIIGEALSALNIELDSLRSCTIRNSVFCLKSVLNLQIYPEWIVSGEKTHIYDEIIGKLLLKSCSGPKFLCKIISEVLVLGAKVLPFARLSVTLLSFSNHKNSEVCNQIYIIACDNFLCQMETMISANDERTVENSLRLFQRGITSVKPAGRDMARKALRAYADRIGMESFNKDIKMYFSTDQCIEIDREIKKVTVKNQIKARVPLKVLKLNSTNTSTSMKSHSEGMSMSKSGAVPLPLAGNRGAKPWATKKKVDYCKEGGLPIPPAAASNSTSTSTSSVHVFSEGNVASASSAFTL